MTTNPHTSIVRVQVLIEENEREAFRQVAEQEGKSLSGWMRESALDRLEATKTAGKITSTADLRRFFKACDLREKGREPDWEEHLKVMEESRKTGRSGT
jgi:CRISPR/Cas system CSM-associated protein Csm2 small subunit